MICVLAAATSVRAESQVPEAAGVPAPGAGAALPAQDIGGRWRGRTFEFARRGAKCEGARCDLVLDIVKCASGWCGVEVLDADKPCGATALTLDAGTGSAGGASQFRGKLELAKGTEPYVVEAYLVSSVGDAERELQIVGDTGGEFRAFRRSFPFSATLVRAGEPSCRPESTVSLLD